MRFEKWQALGNDYLIVERDRAAVRAHPGAGAARCATATSASAPTASSRSSRPTQPGFVARLRIFNPDGSEAELSGNGAREAILYLRRAGLDGRRHVLDPDRGGRDPPDDHRPDDLPRGHGPRRACARRTSRRAAPTARGEVAGHALPARLDRQPAVRDPRRRTRRRSRRSTWRRSARRSSATPLFPNRTNVSFWCASSRPDAHPRADLRARRGGDDVLGHRRVRRRGRPRRCAAATRRSPCALDGGELEVDVDEDLHVDLTGWAVPVYARRAERRAARRALVRPHERDRRRGLGHRPRHARRRAAACSTRGPRAAWASTARRSGPATRELGRASAGRPRRRRGADERRGVRTCPS